MATNKRGNCSKCHCIKYDLGKRNGRYDLPLQGALRYIYLSVISSSNIYYLSVTHMGIIKILYQRYFVSHFN